MSGVVKPVTQQLTRYITKLKNIHTIDSNQLMHCIYNLITNCEAVSLCLCDFCKPAAPNRRNGRVVGGGSRRRHKNRKRGDFLIS